MAKTKISEFNSNPALNTDIDSINIAEGCSPSGINDAIRELMSQLKDWQSGTSNDPYVVGSSGSLTLNQGTANGVAYLNGSKVVTSGSALTFNGTNFGVGVSPALARLHTSTNTATTADFTGSVRITNESYTSGTYAGVLFETADTLNSYVTGIRQGSYAGILAFGVNTGSSGTSLSEGMRLTSTGLGIGTSSPAVKLDVAGAIRSNVSGGTPIIYFNNGSTQHSISNSSGAMPFAIDGSEKMRLDSSGNLGLGVTPSAWQSGARAQQMGATYSLALSAFGDDSSITTNAFYNTSSNWVYQNTASTYKPTRYNQYLGNHIWSVAASTGTAGSTITWSESARIDSSGNLLVGTTSSAGSFRFQVVNTNSSGNAVWLQNASGNDRAILVLKHDQAAGATSGAMVGFQNSAGTTVGTITSSNTATAYNTSSDYRLKNTVAPMTGALAKVAQLKPCTYKWNADGSDGEGFIAHELAEVVPQCVTGEKDAVDAEGKPQYQGIDTSFLVATLTAAIQELKAEFDAYKASHP